MSRTDPLIRFLVKHRLSKGTEFPHASHAIGEPAAVTGGNGTAGAGGGTTLVDYLLLTADDAHGPGETFARLRWGGQVVLVADSPAPIAAAARQYANWNPQPVVEYAGGRKSSVERLPASPPPWIIEQPLASLKKRPLGLPFWPAKKVHYFMARKTALVEPGRSSDRFTYNVFLARNPESARINGPRGTDAYQVVKEVPTTERVLSRLKEKFRDADEDTLKRRARKFTEKIFPVFLTRENAILKLLQRDLPAQFRQKVPQILSADQDPQGYTRTLRLNWLRNGRGGQPPLTQLEFAKQSAELLAALHDDAKIMHLDLRLDNFVITKDGVGFVDFGSAVRVGETFHDASLLSNLFGEMMRTSQIQRMLGKMSTAGQVTSEEIKNSYQKVDKAVDFFYLAVQINNPHANPDFVGLVDYHKDSREAKALSDLTAEILRPTDPEHAKFKSARQILAGIQEIENRLK